MTKVREILPRIRSYREPEKTMKAIEAGSMEKKVVTTYCRNPIFVSPKPVNVCSLLRTTFQRKRQASGPENGPASPYCYIQRTQAS